MTRNLLVIVAAIVAIPLHALAQDNGDAKKAFMDADHKMMEAMHAVAMTGDPDKDFVAMMLPHHQGAVDMAKVELQYGKDPKLRALAEAIVKAQEDEIAEMKAWQAAHP
jgi:uncharacterized protein (DUF305 family)